MKVISYPKRTYHGQLNANGLPHGEGIMEYSNGQQYRGGWLNGQKSGYGTLKTPFQNREKTNPAANPKLNSETRTMTFTEKYWGEIYKGQFFKGAKHGLGKIMYQSGNFFKGSFNMGFKSGYGIQKVEEKIYCGLWECGMMKDEFFVFSLKSGEALEVVFEKGKAVDVTRINPYLPNYFDLSGLRGFETERDETKERRELIMNGKAGFKDLLGNVGQSFGKKDIGFKGDLLKKIKAIERVIHLDTVSVIPKKENEEGKSRQKVKNEEKDLIEEENRAKVDSSCDVPFDRILNGKSLFFVKLSANLFFV